MGPVTMVRLTRDAEVEDDGDSDANPLDRISEQVRKRRYEPVVRLEFSGDADPNIRDLLRQHFQLQHSDIYEAHGELDYTTLFELGRIEGRRKRFVMDSCRAAKPA